MRFWEDDIDNIWYNILSPSNWGYVPCVFHATIVVTGCRIALISLILGWCCLSKQNGARKCQEYTVDEFRRHTPLVCAKLGSDIAKVVAKLLPKNDSTIFNGRPLTCPTNSTNCLAEPLGYQPVTLFEASDGVRFGGHFCLHWLLKGSWCTSQGAEMFLEIFCKNYGRFFWQFKHVPTCFDFIMFCLAVQTSSNMLRDLIPLASSSQAHPQPHRLKNLLSLDAKNLAIAPPRDQANSVTPDLWFGLSWSCQCVESLEIDWPMEKAWKIVEMWSKSRSLGWLDFCPAPGTSRCWLGCCCEGDSCWQQLL